MPGDVVGHPYHVCQTWLSVRHIAHINTAMNHVAKISSSELTGPNKLSGVYWPTFGREAETLVGRGRLWLHPWWLLAAPLLPLVAAALLQLLAAIEGAFTTVSQGRFQRFQVRLVDLHRLWGIALVILQGWAQ